MEKVVDVYGQLLHAPTSSQDDTQKDKAARMVACASLNDMICKFPTRFR